MKRSALQKKKSRISAATAELRCRAEARLRKQRKAQRPGAGGVASAADAQRLVHELQVHEIELEMQNEELSRANARAEASAREFSDLYEFAPAAYLTLDRNGTIRQVNLSGARLLDLKRTQLLNRRLGLFVAKGDRLAFSDFLQQAFAGRAKKQCGVTLPREGSWPLVVQIECMGSADGQECRVAMFDITEQKRAEKALQQAHDELELRVATRTEEMQRANEELRVEITERKQAEEALRNSEEKFRQFFKNSPDYCYIISTEGNILHINKAALKALGYKRNELVGQPLARIYAPECLARMERLFVQWKKGGQIRGEEAVIVTRKGERRVVILNVGAVKDRHGTILHSTSVQTDITERKRAEVSLKTSEERFRQVAETAGEFIWEVNAEGLYTYASPSVERTLGYTSEELVGKKHFYDLFIPAAREDLKAAAFWVFANRQAFRDFPNPNVSKSGRIVYLETSGSPVLNPDGDLAGYRGTDTDVTARKQAEEKFRLVVEASPNGMVLINDQGQIALVNVQTERLFGYTREELVGQTVDMLVPERSRAEHQVHRDEFQKAPRTRIMGKGCELLARRKDGTEFPVEIGLSPIQSAEGNLVLTIIVDITARKQAEAEALQQRAELAHVARVSTMGELAASVAHELNQPLGAILANAEAAELFLAQEPPALDELRDILADIRKDDERAGEVIRRMRALLRKRELERQPLDINSVVEDVFQVVSGDAALHKVSLSADLPLELPKILGDRIHLQQVLLNLMLNGMDAVAGQPRERRLVSVRTRSATPGQVELAVTDLGRGIEPDKLSHVFEPFYTTKPNGMGMGLSIARTIIAAHHGRIWAENHLSGGAVIRISLPIAAEEPKP